MNDLLTIPGFIGTCVTITDVNALGSMHENAKPISCATFRRILGKEAYRTLEIFLGYEEGPLTLANEPYASFYRSTFMEKPVVYLVHSAIDHIFKST